MRNPKIEYIWSLKRPMYLDRKDKRYNKHMKQIKSIGFSDSETWNLYTTIAMFVLPRLIRFKKIDFCHPSCFSVDKWNEILGEMIFAFEWIIKESEHMDNAKLWKSNQKRADKGLMLFAKYFMHLWW